MAATPNNGPMQNPFNAPATEEQPAMLTSALAGRLLAVMVLVMLASAALTFLLPDNRYIRHQQARDSLMFHAAWVYERINFDPTPIDVAVIGSSRLESAVNPVLLSQRLSASVGRPIHAANLSLVKPGRDYNYLTIRNLIEKHRELRVLAVADDGNTGASHDLFKTVANVRDVIAAPMIINTRYFENLLFLPYRNISYAAQSAMPNLFGVQTTFAAKHYLGSDLDRTLGYRTPEGEYVNGDQIASPQLLQNGMADIVRSHQPSLSKKLMDRLPPSISDAGERTYIEKIARLCREHGVKLVFLHVPYFQEPDYRFDTYYRAFGPQFYVDGVRNDPRLFWNVVHLNHKGAGVATTRIARALAPMM